MGSRARREVDAATGNRTVSNFKPDVTGTASCTSSVVIIQRHQMKIIFAAVCYASLQAPYMR